MMIIWLLIPIIKCISSFSTFSFDIIPKNNTFQSHFRSIYQSTKLLCNENTHICHNITFDPTTSFSYILNEDNNLQNHTSLSLSPVEKINVTLCNEKRLSGIYNKDNLTIGSIILKNYTMIKAIHYENTKQQFVIGLQSLSSFALSTAHYQPFVYHLYINNIINDYSYSIEYLSSSKGLITFGRSTSFHKSTYDKKFSIKIPIIDNNPKGLPYFKGEGVLLNNSNLPSIDASFLFGIDESFSFIQIPYELSDVVYKTYLSQVQCSKNSIDKDLYNKEPHQVRYYYYTCKGNDVKALLKEELPVLTFVFKKEKSLSLKKQDLFTTYEGSGMLFNIIFIDSHNDNDLKWLIGDPILKHYRIKHDYTMNKITFYTKNATYKLSNMFMMNTLSILVICVLITGLAIVSIVIYFKKKQHDIINDEFASMLCMNIKQV